MSEQDVELVRTQFEHFLATGEPMWDTLDADVEVRDHDIMDGRAYRGHADIRRWLFEDWAAAWSEFSAEPAEFVDAGNMRVVAIFQIKATGRSSGIEIKRQDAIVYGLRGGLITNIDYYNNKEQALQAAAG